jgi:hypothetical protein
MARLDTVTYRTSKMHLRTGPLIIETYFIKLILFIHVYSNKIVLDFWSVTPQP